MKKKLFYCGDTPSVTTGFGNVARHVLSRVVDKYDITVFGVNEYYVNPKPLPVRIISALPNGQNDPYGKQKFIEFVTDENNKFDIWFLQNDIHSWGWLPELLAILRAKGNDPHIFTYTVVDSPVRREDTWFFSCVDVAGIPSQHGINEILKVNPDVKYKLRYIPHGIDSTEFFPLPSNIVNKFRETTMGCSPDTFLISNVNRNSARKDIARTLLYFSALREKHENIKLYLHMQRDEESYRGWDLNRVIDTNKVKFKDIAFPEKFSTNQGVDTSVLNLIYNASDMVISTTVGEGFGLSCVEAMAAKTLVMMPDHSSLSELMANGRGLPIKCGSTLSEWTILSHDPGHPRPLCNIEDMVNKTEQAMIKRPQEIIDNGYNWVTTILPWDKVINLFIDGFENSCSIESVEGSIPL